MRWSCRFEIVHFFEPDRAASQEMSVTVQGREEVCYVVEEWRRRDATLEGRRQSRRGDVQIETFDGAA